MQDTSISTNAPSEVPSNVTSIHPDNHTVEQSPSNVELNIIDSVVAPAGVSVPQVAMDLLANELSKVPIFDHFLMIGCTEDVCCFV